MTKPIPIRAARDLADQYGYDQVIIYARKCNTGVEHMTTYGVTRAHCLAASKIGNFLKYKIMGWVKESES